MNGLMSILKNNFASDNCFLICEKSRQEFSYNEVQMLALSFSECLKCYGFDKGDRLAVIADNSVELALLYLGCFFSGITVIPINPQSSKSSVEYILDLSKPKVLFFENNYRKLFCDSSIEIVSIELPAINDSQAGDFSFEKKENVNLNDSISVVEDDIAVIVFTSGTTSDPKGVIHKVGSLLGNGKQFVDLHRIDSSNRFLNYLPMTYLGGYYNLLLIPMIAGSSVVISSPFSAAMALKFWKIVSENSIDTIWFVPTIMSILLQVDRGDTGVDYCKKNLKHAFVGTAPLPEIVKSDFIKKYGVSPLENYGLSETFFIATQLKGDKDSSCGAVLSNVEVSIRDSKGGDVQGEADGQLFVKTPYRTEGYLGKDSFDNEFFATGDIGHIKDGRLFITAREKDLIIRGGINISPATIENEVLKDRDVKECAVVGIQDNVQGEKIAVIYTAQDDSDPDVIQERLKHVLKESLSPLSQPSYFYILDDLPKTSSGKVQKAKLREWAVSSSEKLNINMPRVKSAEAHDYFKPSQVVLNSVEAMSIEYNTMVYDMRAAGEKVIVLSLGEAYFDIPLFDFEKLPFPSGYHYSHSRGTLGLRTKISDYFESEYEVKFDPENEILISAGSKAIIYMILLAIINPGDEVIIHEPAWVSYTEQINLTHGVPVAVPYYKKVADFEKYITNRTKIIVINNPNNPSGYVYKLDELAHLYHLAEKYNLIVLSDEAYSDFLFEDEKFISMGNFDVDKKRSIIVNSISKNFGISGWRIGYAIANKSIIKNLLKINQHMITCAPTVLLDYVETYFDEILKYTKPQIKELLDKRETIRLYMNEIELGYLEGTSTFYFFVSIEGSSLDSQSFAKKLLKEYKICAVPGIGYGDSCDKFLRVSIGTETLEDIKHSLRVIKSMILESSEKPENNLEGAN